MLQAAMVALRKVIPPTLFTYHNGPEKRYLMDKLERWHNRSWIDRGSHCHLIAKARPSYLLLRIRCSIFTGQAIKSWKLMTLSLRNGRDQFKTQDSKWNTSQNSLMCMHLTVAQDLLLPFCGPQSIRRNFSTPVSRHIRQ